MLGKYYYHEILKKTVIAFGTVFNNIQIRRKSEVGDTVEVMKVPLAYGPRQKFLARIRQIPDITRDSQVQITIPRISFEMLGISYDHSRKVSPTQTVKYIDNDKVNQAYIPVPYNVDFEVAIITKNQDDALQIVEQILPVFQPNFNLTINVIPQLGEKKDFPITLNSIDYEDDYDGDYEKRRTLTYILRFTTKVYLYGPITDVTEAAIKKAQVDYYAKIDTINAAREVRYTVEPDPSDAMPDDDFGFNELYSDFTDAKKWNPVTGQDEDV